MSSKSHPATLEDCERARMKGEILRLARARSGRQANACGPQFLQHKQWVLVNKILISLPVLQIRIQASESATDSTFRTRNRHRYHRWNGSTDGFVDLECIARWLEICEPQPETGARVLAQKAKLITSCGGGSWHAYVVSCGLLSDDPYHFS